MEFRAWYDVIPILWIVNIGDKVRCRTLPHTSNQSSATLAPSMVQYRLSLQSSIGPMAIFIWLLYYRLRSLKNGTASAPTLTVGFIIILNWSSKMWSPSVIIVVNVAFPPPLQTRHPNKSKEQPCDSGFIGMKVMSSYSFATQELQCYHAAEMGYSVRGSFLWFFLAMSFFSSIMIL